MLWILKFELNRAKIVELKKAIYYFYLLSVTPKTNFYLFLILLWINAKNFSRKVLNPLEKYT